jgi:plasmid stabilization system protein ParE
VSRPLDIEISELAKAQIRTAEDWWRLNRPKAPNAIREELERAASIVSLQREVGTRALNISLSGVRRLHLARVRYYFYYWLLTDPERIEILAFWHESRGSGPPL